MSFTPEFDQKDFFVTPLSTKRKIIIEADSTEELIAKLRQRLPLNIRKITIEYDEIIKRSLEEITNITKITRQLPSTPQNVTDPTRTILTWREFGNTVQNKITEISLTPIHTEEELRLRLLLMETELMEMFQEYLWLMMSRGIGFAVEYMNNTSPDYHFASEWTPADDELLANLMKGCHEYLTKWTEDIRTDAATEIREGISLGESLEQIGSRVSETLDSFKNRGMLIARTELMRAFNKAAENRYQKAGFKMKWLTARDPKVCEICEALEGQIVEIAPPAHVLCRCTIVPVLEKP